MQYKINQIITIRYLAIDNEIGLSDLKLTPTNPSGVDQSLITFTEIGNGLYTASFTPNIVGWWLVRVTSVLKPRNIYSKSYFVGIEYTTYPPQEDGKLTELSNKVGEVQSSPTTHTLLARLKDIYDKLVEMVITGLAKVKIWDGTNIATVTPTGRLQVSSEPPTPPPATTGVNRTDYGSVATSSDNIWIVPTGKTLTLQRFSAGGEQGNAGNVVELWYDPLGTGIGMTIIDALFANGQSTQHDLNESILGDGTIAIRMRRLRFSGGSKAIFGRWEGYY